MAALACAAFVPASLYVTRAIGNSVTQTVLRRQPPQAPDTTIDTDAVLSTADIAVNMKTFTKTAAQLQRFVSQSAKRLRRLIQKTKERQEKHSWSRIFRDPDFSEENKATRNEVDTLKSRIELFFSVLTLMPHHATITGWKTPRARVLALGGRLNYKYHDPLHLFSTAFSIPASSRRRAASARR